MRTMTLKTDDQFFEKVALLAKHLHVSKSELIRRAITEYEVTMKKRQIREQMKQASLRVREANRTIANAFDVTTMDGLGDV